VILKKKKQKIEATDGGSSSSSQGGIDRGRPPPVKQEPIKIESKPLLSKVDRINLSNMVNSNAVVQSSLSYEVAIRTKNRNNQNKNVTIGVTQMRFLDLINFVDSTTDRHLLQLLSENITAKVNGHNIRPFTDLDLKKGNTILREKFYNFRASALVGIIPRCDLMIEEKKATLNMSDGSIPLFLGTVVETTKFGGTTIYKFVDRNETVVDEQKNLAARESPPLDLYSKHGTPVRMMASDGTLVNPSSLVSNVKAIFDANRWDDSFTLNPTNAAVVSRTLKDKLNFYDTVQRNFVSIFGVAVELPSSSLITPDPKKEYALSALPPHVVFASYNSRLKDQIRPKDPLSADLQNYIPWRHVPKDLVVASIRHYIEAVKKIKFGNFIAESDKNVMIQFREQQQPFYLDTHDRLLYFNNGDGKDFDLKEPSFIPLPNLAIFSKIVNKNFESNETRKERNINFVKFTAKLASGSTIVMPFMFPDQGSSRNNQFLHHLSQWYDLMAYPITYENNMILIKRAVEAKDLKPFFDALNIQFYAYAHVNNLRNVAYYIEVCGEVFAPYFRSNPIVNALVKNRFILPLSGVNLKVEKLLGFVDKNMEHEKIDETDYDMSDAANEIKSKVYEPDDFDTGDDTYQETQTTDFEDQTIGTSTFQEKSE
jgi:hypothetical protein